MPPKKSRKSRKSKAASKHALTDLHSAAAHANLHDVFRFHGEGPRGLEFPPTSTLFEGRFGRMFRTLPAADFVEEDLKALAAKMIAPPENRPTPENRDDDEENSGISAGYTYLGQFIDHDLTFDPASSLQKQNDPEALEDFRTPRFDLDNVYGRGPNDQPYLYDDKGLRMLLGRKLTGSGDPGARDLQRNDPVGGRQRALIGDPRNDENVIVSQLQSTMLRFHNRVVDSKPKGTSFEEIQNAVRWHYQWVVLHDFLPTIVGPEMVHTVLPHLKNKSSIYEDKPNINFFRWEKTPFMPIEFSAAVYRFGHSMVRPIYRLNTRLKHRNRIFLPDKKNSSPEDNQSLLGFRRFPSNFAIDWSLFFKMGDPPHFGKKRLQKSYKIDTSLVNPLGHLPKPIGDKVPSLAQRNLIRGWRMGLPSGQTVARFMGLDPIPDEALKVGKATEGEAANNRSITEVSRRFEDNAPLWYYILAEAQQAFVDNSTPIRLGPVGGRVVTEVFVGLLLGDQFSFLSQDPTWTPLEEFTNDKNEFGMAELIKQAMKA
jgi:Animal haem peroxidase